MFEEIPNGSVYEIPDNAFGYVFKCQLPPIGYGVNVQTGELEETDVFKRSDIEEEQYWQRVELPPRYKERRKEEQYRQSIDKSYYDPYLEDFRRKDWHRRLCGVWFWNFNPRKGVSECRYLTGQQYVYVNWWIYQGKRMSFRMPDMETFYVARYTQDDPRCLGLNELTQRKSGKTGRSGCIAYERTSRLSFHHCGIQSKTDTDGWGVFKKAFVQPWRKLPDFYRPIYDLMKGDDPNDELRFFATSRRGQQAALDSGEDALESWVDFGSSEESFYDGPELHTYISDETGKTRKEVSIKERQRVAREATEIDGEIRGWHHSTTTVEVEKGEEENYEFQEFTAQSNPLNRDDNGMTISGYYTFFQPCYKYMYFDKYGYPDEERAKEFVQNRRRALEAEGDLRGLSSYKRKKPLTFKEAFSADGATALYNPELLNRQLDDISWTNKFTERGNLVWKGGFKVKRQVVTSNGSMEYVQSEVEWVDDPNGKFEKVAGWLPKEPNKVFYQGGTYHPNNDIEYAIGCDPFRYDKTKDKRRSNCAAFAYKMPDAHYKTDYDDMFTLRYAHREESTRAANEDILKMAWFCGCKVLFERNVNHWKNDFADWECVGFLAWMPGEVEPGIITTGGQTNSTVQTICNYTEAYINEHIAKVYFKTLIRKETGWLGFKVEETEKFDEPMAAGITLIRVKGVVRRAVDTGFNVQDFFPKYKN